MTLGEMLGFAFAMFALGWIFCWICTFNVHNGNVRKWLGGHIHPRNVVKKP